MEAAQMFRSVLQALRTFTAIVSIGLSFACAQAQTAPAVEEEKAGTASMNLVVRYFSDADLQAETQQQLREIRQALNDAITLPVAELCVRRYANYMMTPDRWAFGKLIGSYFLSTAPIDPESKEFCEDSKKPEAATVLKRRLAEVDEAIPDGAGK
jgi:hypothetical protein